MRQSGLPLLLPITLLVMCVPLLSIILQRKQGHLSMTNLECFVPIMDIMETLSFELSPA